MHGFEGLSLFTVEGIIKLTLACVLGGIIGWEREKNNRPAGFRTHIIVAMSSCLAMLINYKVFDTFEGLTTMDPGRMGSYVISGIGFLGAGTIIREGASVKGLTTAASLWASACLGLAIGSGLYEISIFATLLVIFTLLVMNKIEHRVNNRRLREFNDYDKKEDTAPKQNMMDMLNMLMDEENVEITIKKDQQNSDNIQVIKVKKRENQE